MKRIFEKSLRLAVLIARKSLKYLLRVIFSPVLGLIYLFEALVKLKDWVSLKKVSIMEHSGFTLMFIGMLACINDYPLGHEPDFIIILRNCAIGILMILIGYRLYKISQKLQKNQS